MATTRKRPATRVTVERHYPNGGGRSDGWQVIVSNPLWLKASPVFAYPPKRACGHATSPNRRADHG